MKRVAQYLVLFFFMGAHITNAFASDNFFIRKNNRQESLVGIIQYNQGSVIKILDEQDKRIKRFVLLKNDAERFTPGLRVRIYYSSWDHVIETIQIMRPVEYKKDGQNLGYILKSEE